jgi:signal transduction histidine kinase/ActR/RegA family two-component response regulator
MEPTRREVDQVAPLEAALAASEGRFHSVIERNADGILVVAPEGTIGYANPAAVRLLQRPSEELHGRDFGVPVVPGETTEIDLPLTDGQVRVAELRVTETEWDGQAAYLCTLRDVSERKALEAQLLRKMQELADADRRKDEFLAMLAHELRNPLAPIKNALHIMKHRAADLAMVARSRELIEHEVRSLTRLVDDLLDVSRITTGKVRLRLEPMPLATVVERAIRTARPQLEGKGQSTRTILPGEEVWIRADPVRIEQILVNLLTNASKYSDPGGEIELASAVEGNAVVVMVRDDGLGIAPEMLGRIFDLFQQVDATLDRSVGGLGIGLTLARRLAHLHGGELTAHSEGLGRGSTFALRLPRDADRLVPDAPPSSPRGGTRGPRRRVLIVDDNRAMADSLRDVLQIWGHDCRIAHTGLEALAEFRDYRPDFVLLDIGLPSLDGHAVAAEIHRQPATNRPRVIGMSGYGQTRDLARARESGFELYLVKPIDLDLLERTLGGREPQPHEARAELRDPFAG